MFKAQHKTNKKIYTILDTYLDETYPVTYFLVYENDNWRWRPATNFIPYEYELPYEEQPIFNFNEETK